MSWNSELEDLMPPPPAEQKGAVPSDAQWQEVEAQLGVPIPADYKLFVGTWGADGSIGDFFYYYTPGSQFPALRLPKATEKAVSAYDTLRDHHPAQFPMPKFPAEGSFFPIGVTDNGDYFGWIIGAGDSESWKAAWLGDEEGEADVYDMAFGPWLLALVKGAVKGKAMSPTIFLDGPLKFTPSGS